MYSMKKNLNTLNKELKSYIMRLEKYEEKYDRIFKKFKSLQ